MKVMQVVLNDIETQSKILIQPPRGMSDDLSAQLQMWAKRDGRGKAFDSSCEFLLPSGAARSPDAAWILKTRLAALSAEQKRKFLPLCPDFVVELRSPSDRLPRLQAKVCTALGSQSSAWQAPCKSPVKARSKASSWNWPTSGIPICKCT